MGDWEKVLRNNGWYSKISECYGQDFPIEIRGLLADFLRKNQNDLNSNANVSHFIFSLKAEVSAKLDMMASVSNPETKNVLQTISQSLRLKLNHIQKLQPAYLFDQIKNSLRLEEAKITELESYHYFPHHTLNSNGGADSTRKEKSFVDISAEIDKQFEAIQQIKIRETLNTLYAITQTDQYPAQHSWAADGTSLLQQQLYEFMNKLATVHETVLKELRSYNNEQLHVSLGKLSDKQLDSFEIWFRSLVQWLDLVKNDYLPEYNRLCESFVQLTNAWGGIVVNEINELRQRMNNACLVIEKQPADQLYRTKTTFADIKVRLLPYCNQPVGFTAKADFVLINENTAKDIHRRKVTTNFPEPLEQVNTLPADCGEWQWNVEPVEVDKSKPKLKRKLSVPPPPAAPNKPVIPANIFYRPKCTLTKVNRNASKGQQLFERFWMLIQVTVNNAEKFTELSLPIWISTHNSQFSGPWTEMVWYNAFPIESRIGLDVPTEIEWCQLIQAINYHFAALGRSLSVAQKDFLMQKLFRNNVPTNRMVHKESFCSIPFSAQPTVRSLSEKERPLEKDRDISFGEWIYFCWNILCWKPKNGQSPVKPLQDHWRQGKILGFISVNEMEMKLRGNGSDIFILRFPEKWAEILSLYFYLEDESKWIRVMFSTRHFHQVPLENLISELPYAAWLYSDFKSPDSIVDVKEAFPKINFSESIVPSDGYVLAKLRPYVPRCIQDMFRGDRSRTASLPNVPGLGPSYSFLSSILSRENQ